MAHGRNKPITRKIRLAAANSKKKSRTISTAERYGKSFLGGHTITGTKNPANPLIRQIRIYLYG
jgi:hypothetical protein